jgi:hypothetical protein
MLVALSRSSILGMEAKWAVEKSTQWLARGNAVALRGSELPGSIRLEGAELFCDLCFLATLSGTASELDAVASVPSDGYATSIPIGSSSSLAIVKFDDGTFAKLAIESTSYDPEATGQNAGITLTSVLSVKE